MAEDMRTGVDHDLTLAERLGKATMDMLDHLDEAFPGCELETVAVVCAVRAPRGWTPPDLPEDADHDEVKITGTDWASHDHRRHSMAD